MTTLPGLTLSQSLGFFGCGLRHQRSGTNAAQAVTPVGSSIRGDGEISANPGVVHDVMERLVVQRRSYHEFVSLGLL